MDSILLVETGDWGKGVMVRSEDVADFVRLLSRAQIASVDGYGADRTLTNPKPITWSMQFLPASALKQPEPQPQPNMDEIPFETAGDPLPAVAEPAALEPTTTTEGTQENAN